MAIEGNSGSPYGDRIRLGMVGGGQGAFIGGVHRIASRIDDNYALVAGALSSDPERAIASGLELGLDPKRAYGSYQDMAKRERRLRDGIDRAGFARRTGRALEDCVDRAALDRIAAGN